MINLDNETYTISSKDENNSHSTEYWHRIKSNFGNYGSVSLNQGASPSATGEYIVDNGYPPQDNDGYQKTVNIKVTFYPNGKINGTNDKHFIHYMTVTGTVFTVGMGEYKTSIENATINKIEVDENGVKIDTKQ